MEFNLRNSVIERCKNTFDLIKKNNPYFSYSIFKTELIKESESILDKIKYRVNLTSKTTDEDLKIGFDNSIDIEHLTQSQINAAYYFLIESITYLKENGFENQSNIEDPALVSLPKINIEHTMIFKGNAFEVWQRMFEEFKIIESSRADVKFIFEEMKKDGLIHNTVSQTSFLYWISKNYNGLEVQKTSNHSRTKERISIYNTAKTIYIKQ